MSNDTVTNEMSDPIIMGIRCLNCKDEIFVMSGEKSRTCLCGYTRVSNVGFETKDFKNNIEVLQKHV